MISRIWNALGSIHLTLTLIGLMTADLVLGFFMLRKHGHIFHPLNDLGFVKWAATWGRESIGVSAWLFILVGLLALLSLNTFVCTTDRVIVLWRHRRHFAGPWRFLLRLGPHIMHYSMLLMFTGYLFSYVLGTSYPAQVLLPGKQIRVAGVDIALDRLDISYHGRDEALRVAKKAKDVRVLLTFSGNGETRTVPMGFNRPARFQGLSAHLMNFAPKSSSGMKRRKYITMIVKHDPGTGFYFCGMFLFTAGLFLYAWDKILPGLVRKGTKINIPGRTGQEKIL